MTCISYLCYDQILKYRHLQPFIHELRSNPTDYIKFPSYRAFPESFAPFQDNPRYCKTVIWGICYDIKKKNAFAERMCLWAMIHWTFIKLQTRVLYTKLWSKWEFCENWLSSSHTLLTCANKVPPILSTFIDQSGWNSLYKNQSWFLRNPNHLFPE